MDFSNFLGGAGNRSRIGNALMAMGAGFQGGDAGAVVKRYEEGIERAQRKEAIAGLMSQMGIGQPQQEMLATLPLEAQQQYLLNQMTPQKPEYKVVNGRLLRIDGSGASVAYDGTPQTMSNSDFLSAMGMSESGNNYAADNGLGYVGRVQFGKERLSDFARANNMGEITLEQFRSNPDLQRQAEQWHFSDLAKAADKHSDLYGTEINGVPVTREALMAIGHLGGEAGMDKYVRTGGQYNPSDAFGTSLADYHRKFAGTTFQQPQQGNVTAEKLNKLLLSPNLTKEQRQYVERELKRISGGGLEAEAEIARLMEAGLDRNTAILIKEGVLTASRDPLTGEVVVVNKATGQVVGQPAQQSAPAQRPSAPQSPLSFGTQFENADRAGGVGGAIRGVANTAADAVGMDMPFPETDQAQRDFANFSESIVNTIASGYNRQPPSWLLKNISELAPRPGVTEGPEKTRNKLQALGREIETRKSALESSLQRRMKPSDRAQMEGQIVALDAGLAQIQQAISGFSTGAPQGTTKSGIQFRIVE